MTNVECALDYDTPWQLVVAVILSAQCTDEMVNKVTPGLFRAHPTPASLAAATQESVEELVHSTGFYRNKAKNIIACAKRVIDEFGGEVPQTMDELLSLAGVARKTANVVLGEVYGIAEGVVVDTHVKRISNLLGLTKEQDPKKIEQEMMVKIPRDHWIRFAHQLIHHGRRTCIARRPKCEECFLADHCPSADL